MDNTLTKLLKVEDMAICGIHVNIDLSGIMGSCAINFHWPIVRSEILQDFLNINSYILFWRRLGPTSLPKTLPYCCARDGGDAEEAKV